MKLISGLGNPTKQYELTRHNAGFMAIDKIGNDLGLSFKRNLKTRSLIAEKVVDGSKVVLVKPMTYMNLSGIAIAEAARLRGIECENIMVICDDIYLEPGQIRIRSKGGSGGHNGLKSIIDHLGTDRFPRLRIGVGRQDNAQGDLTGHVLSRFTKEQSSLMDSALDNASKAVNLYLYEGIEAAMRAFN